MAKELVLGSRRIREAVVERMQVRNLALVLQIDLNEQNLVVVQVPPGKENLTGSLAVSVALGEIRERYWFERKRLALLF
jgi:hypothetical protein